MATVHQYPGQLGELSDTITLVTDPTILVIKQGSTISLYFLMDCYLRQFRYFIKEMLGELMHGFHSISIYIISHPILYKYQQLPYPITSPLHPYTPLLSHNIMTVQSWMVNVSHTLITSTIITYNQGSNKNRNSIYNQPMQTKKRPYSSKPVSSIPLMVDQSKLQDSSDYDMKLTECVPNNLMGQGKNKLNQIIPELPQFGIKSNNTALLYSKFIVKGLKEDKISIVRTAFRKKQEVTEAATIYKNRNKSIKTITRVKTGELVDNFMAEDTSAQNTHNMQLNTLLRASSAKVFRKTMNKQQNNVDNQYIERTLSKNKTQANLHKAGSKKRPTTAKLFREKDSRFSYGITIEQQNFNEVKSAKRPTTSFNNNQNRLMAAQAMERSMYTEQLTNLVGKKIKDRPIRIQTITNIDHIERNKQNISSYNRKASSIYLTNTNLDQVMRNRKQSSQKSQIKSSQQMKSTTPPLQVKPQKIFVQADKTLHQQKLQQIEHYLEQSVPSKLQLVTQQLRKQYKKTQTQQNNENYQQLLSINLDNGFEQNHSELNQRSAKACFDDYIQNCQILQYNISSKLKSEQLSGGNYATLNICQCQQVIEIYKGMTVEKDEEKRMKMVDQIRELTKNLKYFSHKPKQQIDKFFTIPFQILIADQEYVAIQLNSVVENIYIILNGSALMQTNSTNQFELPSRNFGEKLLNTQHSLYDGEIFGEPAKPSEKYYKMRVTILEQSLLLKIRYEDYIAKFFEGSEIEQKLGVLRVAFQLERMRALLTEEDLQILSLSLEKHRYPSKSLIYRQGQIFDKLVLVAKGKLVAINQYILDQDKIRSSDMKQLDKNIRQQKQNTRSNQTLSQKKLVSFFTETDLQVDKISVERMRRQNLINYEVLRQDSRRIQYYFMKEQAEFVKGDSINWKPLFIEFNSPTSKLGESTHKNVIVPIKPVSFSLMSNSNDTEVYFLSRSAFQYLPNNIKKVLLAKGQYQQSRQIKPQTEKQIKNWNNFKQKLCNSIIQQSKDKKSKNKF